jgi:hypothetical protein
MHRNLTLYSTYMTHIWNGPTLLIKLLVVSNLFCIKIHVNMDTLSGKLIFQIISY